MSSVVAMFLLCAIGSEAPRLKIYHIDVDEADATLRPDQRFKYCSQIMAFMMDSDDKKVGLDL